MKKITMNEQTDKTFTEVFQMFVVSQTAKGLSEVTLKNYRYHMKNMAKYLNVERSFGGVTKRDVETMVVEMRAAGLSHNTVATYVRLLKTFYNWCDSEGLSSITINSIKEKETVKETYTDEELKLLLQRPDKNCNFGEFRSWALVNFLMNSGCRAATARSIQNKDVDLEAMQVTFRHNKNGKVQVIPLCSLSFMVITIDSSFRELYHNPIPM